MTLTDQQDEITVEQALAELRETRPDFDVRRIVLTEGSQWSLAVEIMLLAKFGEQAEFFNGKTIYECMAQVRARKANQ